jgi:hypothetical protein|tara:strand:- start:8764 stop:8913 length:150 start_codon:yes stop_codon:yes gene_type:complete
LRNLTFVSTTLSCSSHHASAMQKFRYGNMSSALHAANRRAFFYEGKVDV